MGIRCSRQHLERIQVQLEEVEAAMHQEAAIHHFAPLDSPPDFRRDIPVHTVQ